MADSKMMPPTGLLKKKVDVPPEMEIPAGKMKGLISHIVGLVRNIPASDGHNAPYLDFGSFLSEEYKTQEQLEFFLQKLKQGP
jgi:hypothetical protein